MSMLSVIAFLSVTVSSEVPKMPSPRDRLFELSMRDRHAALHFCAARPALHAKQGEKAASDVDAECDVVIRTNFDDALHLPALRELGPSMIRALEKSPTLFHHVAPYTKAYHHALARADAGHSA